VRPGSPDRWDYVVYDVPSHRVYVAHGDRVTVLDRRSGGLVRQIETVPGGTHGIAISHAAGLGYTVDADAVTIDPTSGHAYVVDGDAGTLTVIEPTADRVDATWPIPQCRSPHGFAIDVTNHRLFSSCNNRRLVFVNADTGRSVAVVQIAPGTDAVRFDPVHRLVFSSNGLDGNLSVIREVDANTFVPAATVRTALSARTMGIDPQSGRLFLAAAFEAARSQGRELFLTLSVTS